MTRWRNCTDYGKRIGMIGGFMGKELLLFTVITIVTWIVNTLLIFYIGNLLIGFSDIEHHITWNLATVISAIMTFIFSK